MHNSSKHHNTRLLYFMCKTRGNYAFGILWLRFCKWEACVYDYRLEQLTIKLVIDYETESE